jgi:nucleoside-diphosphate-sugar epimerase
VTAPPVWVTGGAGFLGSRVVRYLASKGHDVCCLVRSQTAADALSGQLSRSESERVRFLFGSVNDIDACRALVRNGRIGYHLASALGGSSAALFLGNVVATRTLLQAIREEGCSRFVLVSSLAVYAAEQPSGTVLDERSPLDPAPHLRDPYAFSKIVQEQVCWSARQDWNLPLVSIRPGIIYGPGRECLTVRVGLRVGPLLMRMGGRQRLPYTYVDNCAEGVVLGGTIEGIDGEAFNIIDDELPTGLDIIREYRARVASLRSLPIPLWAVQPLSRWYTAYSRYSQGQLPPILTPYRAAAQWNSLQYSNQKAKARLNWRPAVSLSEGLRRTLTQAAA